MQPRKPLHLCSAIQNSRALVEAKPSKVPQRRIGKSKHRMSKFQKMIEEICSKRSLNDRVEILKRIQKCSVCFNPIHHEDFIQFSPVCKHAFCKDCLKGHIASQLNLFREISCLEEGCPEVAREDSVIYREELSLEQKVKYYRILVHHNVNRQDYQRLCPNEHCEGYIVTNEQPVVCVICGTKYCLQCMMPRHEGDCDEHGVEFLKANMHFQRCEKCRAMVEKKQGCNHMTCRCGHQFCYLCGGTWGPNHKCKAILLSKDARGNAVHDINKIITVRDNRRPQLKVPIQQSSLSVLDATIHPIPRQPANPQHPENESISRQTHFFYKIFLAIVYAIFFLPVDILINLGLVSWFLLLVLKDLMVGMCFRSVRVAWEWVQRKTSISEKIARIIVIILIAPLLCEGVVRELKDNACEFPKRAQYQSYIFFIFQMKVMAELCSQ